MSEFSFYQIDAVGPSEPDCDVAATRSDVFIRRAFDSKISNFGALSVGNRMSSDYTRVNLGFVTKDDLSDWDYMTKADQDANIELNPYVLGSSVKRTRDDQFFRMGMSNQEGESIDLPKYDVSDTKEVSAEGMVAGKNWPSEGWRSLGGKYDFPYTGGGIH